MPLDFPANPNPGDQWTGSNGVDYIWDGIKWVAAGTGGGTGAFLPLAGGTMLGPLNVIATGATTARSVQSEFADTANALDFGADPTGSADSTAAINAALATGKSVYLPSGDYYVTNAIIVGAGNVTQRLFGDGEGSCIHVDTDFSPTAPGVVILTGSQSGPNGIASHPGVEHLRIQFAIPTDITATLASASTNVLTLTAPVPAGVVVGDYVTDNTNWTGIPANSVTMNSATPVEGAKVTQILGDLVFLSLDVTPSIAPGDQIRFAHPRAMFRALGANPPPGTGVGGYGARYPWAIYADGAGCPLINDIQLDGAYDGIWCHPGANGGNFIIQQCRIGAMNVGIDLDNGYDGGFVDGMWFNAYGIYVPAQTTNTAFGAIYYDGQTVAMNVGRTDGVIVSGFGSLVAKLNITSSWTFGQFVDLDLDFPQAAFSANGFGSGLCQITNFRGQRCIVANATIQVTNFSLDGAVQPVPFLVVDSGGQVFLTNGILNVTASGDVVVSNGATLRLHGVIIYGGTGATWTGGLIREQSGSAIDMIGCSFLTTGGGPGLTMADDSQWSSVFSNRWHNVTFTPPGQLGKYESSYPSEQGGIVAAGTAQGTATQLISPYSNVTSVPAPDNGVILPSWAPLGSRWVIWNNGANALNVWPPPGFSLSGAAPNAAVSLAAGTHAVWIAWDSSLFMQETPP